MDESEIRMMAIYLNAFPLKLPDKELSACVIPFTQELLNTLRTEYQSTHVFRRQGDSILIFSQDGQYPVTGKTETINLKDSFGASCFLVKVGLIRYLTGLKRRPIGFNPIELLSTKPEDNLLATVIKEAFPFQIYVKYTLDTRIIRGKPCLIIDCSTRRTVSENCLYFLSKGFDLKDRCVVAEQEDGFRKLLGYITEIDGESLHVVLPDGRTEAIQGKDAYLEASRKNFDDYVSQMYGRQKDAITEKLRETVSSFNRGENKKSRIDALKKYFQSKGIVLIDGTRIEIEDAENIQNECGQMDKPVFVFNDNGEANWAEKGLSQYGPYT